MGHQTAEMRARYRFRDLTIAATLKQELYLTELGEVIAVSARSRSRTAAGTPAPGDSVHGLARSTNGQADGASWPTCARSADRYRAHLRLIGRSAASSGRTGMRRSFSTHYTTRKPEAPPTNPPRSSPLPTPPRAGPASTARQEARVSGHSDPSLMAPRPGTYRTQQWQLPCSPMRFR